LYIELGYTDTVLVGYNKFIQNQTGSGFDEFCTSQRISMAKLYNGYTKGKISTIIFE
jgi:hypothetical protein